MNFIEKLFIEYPIPRNLSIWGGDNLTYYPVESISDLVTTVVDELSEDIFITEYIEAQGMRTYLPDTTTKVLSAQLTGALLSIQGNRLVKVSYDPSTHSAFLRYYPAIITYQRKLTVPDLDNLIGDRLIYCKVYSLWKMSEKELSVLKSVNMNVDNGAIDLAVLESFRDKMLDKYNELKPEILIYGSVQ